mmetsp:Transcript_20773/g.37829  ORF Transcript_20773/g.37829 Transcript_20773/m.37829 type:complete len:121 (-) Transcript_20773:9-371(-)
MAFLTVLKGPGEWGNSDSIAGFVEAAGPRAQLLSDEEKMLWQLLGQTQRISAFSLLRPSVLCSLLQSLSKEAGDQDGEGLLAGGGLLLNSAGQVCYAWQEEVVGSRPSDDEIEAELNALT